MTIAVTAEVAAEQGLTPDEYAKILKVLGRTPTFEELAVFGVMWSEHCSYKSSRAYLRQLPSKGPQVLQGPGENAGAIDIGDGLAAVFKVESHNHPSFVEPFQGAATGVGGILRDIFTMGARPVAILDSLRFGGIDHPRTPFLVKGVVGGVGHYGNCIGVPTVGGEVVFDPGYENNILVNAFTIGIAPADRLFRASAAGPGNPVIYVGSRTGRDGIHGASLLASAALDELASEKRPAVQVGDPFAEKLLLEACLELMKTDYIVGIQDMGAAGLTSSSLEMAGRGGAGLLLDLDKVPRREEGMTPYEVLLSESQERMLLVARAGTEEQVAEIYRRWDLQAVVIGHVTDDGIYRARWEGKEVCALPVAALTDAAPVYRRPASEPAGLEELQRLDPASIPQPTDYTQTLSTLLESPNLCSREWVFRQYDQFVGANTLLRPGADAAVVRIEGTRRALALTLDCNGRYGRLDPYLGAMLAVVEAARNCVAVGAKPLAVSDCLNYGNPERPDVMWEFQQGINGIRDACLALGTPVVSGNVSFYNETDGRSIPPTPTIAMVGLLDDIDAMLTPWWKGEGDAVVLLGRTREELGASEYLSVIHGLQRGTPPWIDLETEKRLHQVVLAAAQERLLRSAHDVGEGGLAVALAECSFGGTHLGVRATLEEGIRADALLFGESQSRMVVSLRRRHLSRLRDLARREDVPLHVLGEVRGHSIVIDDLVDLPVEASRERWRRALERRLGA
ncbi:MAG TPA: phosphoribosylformylglycinamidine synthase subunit PurL [Candidatus Binatia bacterium]|jgi:phosphoribosylformylglycinamidine synthase|nr:phosphoribosylformylglycinamidine synthase subunit PurL [Candidatus Binatia bacterium]